MKRMLITTIACFGIAALLSFAMSAVSFASPPTAPSGPITSACVQKNNANNVRFTNCTGDEDCLPSEVCVTIGSSGGGCPSIIGGGTIYYTDNDTWIGYFTSAAAYDQSLLPDPSTLRLEDVEQSVETAGSVYGLNVHLSDAPGRNLGWKVDFVLNGKKETNLEVELKNSQTDNSTDPKNKSQCVDVNPGNLIAVRATAENYQESIPGYTYINHTVTFNGCLCCNGKPPVNDHCGD